MVTPVFEQPPPLRRSHPMKAIPLLLVALVLFPCFQCKGTCDNPDTEFLILGGGMSGISAGKTLHNGGYTNFIILEARDKVGGRLKAVDFAGVKVEVGANWIHGVDPTGTKSERANPVWTLANACGLRMVRGEHSSIAVYDALGRDVTRDLPWDEARNAWAKLKELGTRMRLAGDGDMSLREALDRVHWKPATAADHFVDWFNYSKSAGQRVEDQSFFAALDDTTYTDFGSDLYFVTDQRGYSHLVECLGRDFLDANHLRLNTRVTSVHHSDKCVCTSTITMKEGAGGVTGDGGGVEEEQYCGKYGVLTFSLGVLQEEGATLFLPSLPPWKREALASLKFGHFTKVFLLFNETFWDTSYLYIGRALPPTKWGHPLFQPLGHLFDQRPHLIMAILSGEDAMRVASQDVRTTGEQLTADLQSLYPGTRAALLDLLVPNWAGDPLYRGAYSFPGVGSDGVFSRLASPVGNLYFSGEATSHNYYGYVHGAYVAGVDVAKVVMGVACSNASPLPWGKMSPSSPSSCRLPHSE